MYIPRTLRRTHLLWYLSGMGQTNSWSPFEVQRRGVNCQMVAFTPRKADQDQWADLYSPGCAQQGVKSRVAYLN